jgi:DNA-binding NtrC family response regulator
MTTRKKKVLIIDDEVDLCLLMKTYFLRKNYEVYIAHTLADGMTRLNASKPDYLFIDYNLPDGLGWDKLPEMYQHHPEVQYHLISAFRPTMPPDSPLDGAKLTIWEKPISLKSLDNFF